jgi:Calcineurin-like phosphoesterase
MNENACGSCIVKRWSFQIRLAIFIFVLCSHALSQTETSKQTSIESKSLKVWVFSDPHVDNNLKYWNRESLAEAIRQSEAGSMPFDWDIALALGDFSSADASPSDDVGREVVRQFKALKKHNREDIYSIAGNHDATIHTDEETQWWFRKWVDPLGENPTYSGVNNKNRKYPVIGSWERYYFRAGNILFLMMSDRNDLPPPIGKIVGNGSHGGYPAGAITSETYKWWKGMIEENSSKNIVISAHHHMIKDTTTASGDWEGFGRRGSGCAKNNDDECYSYRGYGYHGYFPEGAPEGASYLYFVGDKPDAGILEKYLQENPGSQDFWLGGHTHLQMSIPTPKEYLERKWGTTFINCAPLTATSHRTPTSRLITFTEGSDKAKVQFYMHADQNQGWNLGMEREVSLSKAFSFKPN